MHTDTASETIVIFMLMLIAELGWAEGTAQHRTPPPESAGCTSPSPESGPVPIVFQVNSLLRPLPLIRMSKLLNSETIEKWP